LHEEGDQSIQPASGAPKTGEPAGQTAASQEVTELLLNEARKPVAVPQRRGLGAEGLETVADDPVQDGGGGIARFVRGRQLRHAASGGVAHATRRDR
jgi:hypothetical protein